VPFGAQSADAMSFVGSQPQVSLKLADLDMIGDIITPSPDAGAPRKSNGAGTTQTGNVGSSATLHTNHKPQSSHTKHHCGAQILLLIG
jgi:hypothetical protein